MLIGNSGIDRATYSTSSEGISVNLAANTGFGGDAENDTFNSIERVYGSAHGDAGTNVLWGYNGNDRLYGGSGNDVLYGQNGNDFLRGEDGNDYLFGMAGNDWMYGGAGNDRFRVDGDFGLDIIADYEDEADRIQVTGLGINNFAELQALMSEANGNVDIDFSNGSTLRIFYTSISDFDAGDFIF